MANGENGSEAQANLQMVTAYRAFISHQSRDKQFVIGLATCLRHNGIDVFLDTWDILGGDSIPAEIEAAIGSCNLFVYVLSPAAIESKWVQAEYHAYLYRKLNEQSVRIIPLLRQKANAPPLIAPLKALDFTQSPEVQDCDPMSNPPLRELLAAIYRTALKPPAGTPHAALASFEFFYQRKKSPRIGETDLYEFAFKNLTESPLINFEFAVRFRSPVEAVTYDFERSSANFTGGSQLSDDGKRFHWRGNQIAEDGGWVVFTMKAPEQPLIERISTKLLGRLAGTNTLLLPDAAGLRDS